MDGFEGIMVLLMIAMVVIPIAVVISSGKRRAENDYMKANVLGIFNGLEIGEDLSSVEYKLGVGIKESEKQLASGKVKTIYSWYYGEYFSGSSSGTSFGKSGVRNYNSSRTSKARIKLTFQDNKLVSKEQRELDQKSA